MKKHFLIFTISLLFFSLAQGKVKLPAMMGDHMVLQQNSSVKLWGWADGKKVTVTTSWNNRTYKVSTDDEGAWLVKVDTPAGSFTPYSITMDADLQDSPDEIPELYRMITEDGYDLVSGWKQKRYDPLSKTIPTKLFNATARKVSGIKNLHDFNCGLKAYRKDVIKNIEVYGEMHRYIPYLAKNAGFKKIGEKVVRHQARKFGKTKFGGWNRFFNGYLDLISLWFLSTFGIKPMHFFGILGSLMFFVGFVAVIIVGASKLYYMNQGMPYRLVTDSPYFYLSLTSMIIGTQLFVAGFLGELISRNAPERNKYQIEKMI